MLNKFKRLNKKINNISLFYLFSIVEGAFFLEGNWIMFYLIFFSYQVLGYVDSIGFTIALLLEIPSGAIADLIGRKRTIQFAYLLITIGLFTEGIANTPVTLFIGNIIFLIGYAFYSGSVEAITYDSMLEKNNEKEYPNVIARAKSMKMISKIFGALIGGFLASVNLRLPFLLLAFTNLIAFIFSFKLKEPKIDTVKVSFSSYLKKTFDGIKELGNKNIKPYIFFILIILGIFYWFDWGLVKPAVSVNFGFDTKEMGIIFATTGLLVAIVMIYLPKFRKVFNDYTALSILNFLSILCIFLFGLNINNFGAIPLILMGIVGTISEAWISIIVNKHINSSNRATTLSAIAMIVKTPYILTAILSGYFIDNGYLSHLMLSIALILGFSSLINLTRREPLLNIKNSKL